MSGHATYGHLSRRLRQARAALGLTMREVAEAVEVTVTYISHLEAGRARPALAMTARLASALKMDPDELAILAGHVPADVQEMLRRDPIRAVNAVREAFATYERQPSGGSS